MWIRTQRRLPKDGQCCHVVFDHDDPETQVWFAKYEDGKWYGFCFDSEGVQELSGDAICWTPEPTNPFDDDP